MDVTEHQLRAAAHVALLVDASGNQSIDLARAYQLAQTSGLHGPGDLAAAESLLLLGGLLEEIQGRIVPTALLSEFLALGDLELATHVLTARVFGADDFEARRDFGALGEIAVLERAREELLELGYKSLAEQVSRVSLLDDTLGYDILAPSISGHSRFLEVKTSRGRHPRASIVRFYISRNEVRVGESRRDEWALVSCELPSEASDGLIMFSWCRASSFAPYLPQDAGGRWEQARVDMPRHLLTPGLPPPL